MLQNRGWLFRWVTEEMQVGSRVISVNMFNVDKGIYDNSSAGLYDILKVNNDPDPTTTIVDDGVIQVSTVIPAP